MMYPCLEIRFIVLCSDISFILWTQYPYTEAQYPYTEAQYPITEPQYPITEAQYPITEPQYPITEAQYPYTKAQYPITKAQYPYTKAQYPYTKAQYPYTEAQYPYTEAQYPITQAIHLDLQTRIHYLLVLAITLDKCTIFLHWSDWLVTINKLSYSYYQGSHISQMRKFKSISRIIKGPNNTFSRVLLENCCTFVIHK